MLWDKRAMLIGLALAVVALLALHSCDQAEARFSSMQIGIDSHE